MQTRGCRRGCRRSHAVAAVASGHPGAMTPAPASVTPMNLTRVPVPGPGAEDVVVATHGRDEGAVFTGTEDGNIFRVSHDGRRIDRVAHTGGRPLGLEIDPDGRLLVCDAHRGVLRVDTATGAVEPVDRQRRRQADGLLQQRRGRLRRHDLVLRLLDEVRHRQVEGRLRPGHPDRPAAAARRRRRGRGRPRRARVRQRGRAQRRRGLRRGRRDRPRAPSYATGSPGTARGSATSSSGTCPATPTTSRGAATA